MNRNRSASGAQARGVDFHHPSHALQALIDALAVLSGWIFMMNRA